MTTLSTSSGQGFWHSLSHGLSRALASLAHAARLLFGLGLLAAAFAMGLLLAAVLVLRAAFAKRRRPTPAGGAAPGPSRAASRRPPAGEVVDIEAREIGPRAQ